LFILDGKKKLQPKARAEGGGGCCATLTTASKKRKERKKTALLEKEGGGTEGGTFGGRKKGEGLGHSSKKGGQYAVFKKKRKRGGTPATERRRLYPRERKKEKKAAPRLKEEGGSVRSERGGRKSIKRENGSEGERYGHLYKKKGGGKGESNVSLTKKGKEPSSPPLFWGEGREADTTSMFSLWRKDWQKESTSLRKRTNTRHCSTRK